MKPVTPELLEQLHQHGWECVGNRGVRKRFVLDTKYRGKPIHLTCGVRFRETDDGLFFDTDALTVATVADLAQWIHERLKIEDLQVCYQAATEAYRLCREDMDKMFGRGADADDTDAQAAKPEHEPPSQEEQAEPESQDPVAGESPDETPVPSTASSTALLPELERKRKELSGRCNELRMRVKVAKDALSRAKDRTQEAERRYNERERVLQAEVIEPLTELVGEEPSKTDDDEMVEARAFIQRARQELAKLKEDVHWARAMEEKCKENLRVLEEELTAAVEAHNTVVNQINNARKKLRERIAKARSFWVDSL